MTDHCPRDQWGFCWIAIWHPDDCGGMSDENGGPVRCPETQEEAQGRMEAARQHCIKMLGGTRAAKGTEAMSDD